MTGGPSNPPLSLRSAALLDIFLSGVEVMERVSDSAMTEGVVVATGFGGIAVKVIFAFAVELASSSSSDTSSLGSSSSSPDSA